MTNARATIILSGCSLLVALLQMVLTPSITSAESYVAGQFGATFPQSLSQGKVTQDGIAGLEISDQPLQKSLSIGGKFGHYLSKTRWLGFETGLSYTTPHVKEGALTFSGPGGSSRTPTYSGLTHRVYTWDIVTVMFRYPGYRLQPYIGIGPSLFYATLKGPEAPPGQSAMAIGFNAETGVRYYITRNWAVFGEGKYNRARLGYTSNDSNVAADPFGFRATYSALTVSLGLSYHF